MSAIDCVTSIFTGVSAQGSGSSRALEAAEDGLEGEVLDLTPYINTSVVKVLSRTQLGRFAFRALPLVASC